MRGKKLACASVVLLLYITWETCEKDYMKQVLYFNPRLNITANDSTMYIEPECFNKYEALRDSPINILEFTDEQKDFFKGREKVYMERKNRVKKICESLHGLGNHQNTNYINLSPHHIGFLPSKAIAVCFNPKVASSTWKMNLYKSEFPDAIKENVGYFKSPFRNKSESLSALTKCMIKIMFVRHPFSRLVSAYNDKLANRGRASVKRIVTEDGNVSPTFREFIEHLIKTLPVNANPILEVMKNTTNVHWQHFYTFCSVCDLDYDIIGYMETSNEDTRYISERFGLNFDKKLKKNTSKNSSELTALHLFKEIPRHMILELYKRYKVDFDMFGYSPKAYLDYKDK